MINPAAEFGAWFLRRTGAAVHETLSMGEILSRSLACVKGSDRESLRRIGRGTVEQIFVTGVLGLPVAGLLSVVAGFTLGKFVEYQNLYAVIAPLIDLLARYLVPLMTMAVIVIRSSVMITSDLEGLRRLGQLGPPGELDAEAFRRVFLPRLAGIVVGSVGLCCVATALATVAMISVVAGHPSVAGMDYLRTVAPESGVQAALLGSIYGVIVALVSLHHGLLVKPGSTEMPRAASLAMVKSVAYCTAVTALLPLVQS